MSQKLERGFIVFFNGALLASLIAMAILMVVSLFDNESYFGITIWIFYTNLFILWPSVALSIIGLIFIYFKTYGFKTGSEKSSFRILSLLFAILLVYFGSRELGYRNNKLDVILKNHSESTIKHIELFGRGALSELDSLAPNADTTVIFRGKKILRDLANDYENELSLAYYTESKIFRQPILENFGRWRVLGTGIQLDFFSKDSVQIRLLFED